MTETTIVPGQLIDGRYRISKRLADGGMATVYKAMDERLERVVAVKVMHTQLALGPQRDQFIERFHREARSAAAIANPHIVQVYDTGIWQGLSFLVMEYVHGVNLRQEMNAQGTFDMREGLRIISQILNGLASAHGAGVIHRDIKPENILLDDRGHVKITDFGLARAISQATVSTTGMLLGTAAYLPPETIENNEATPQGDLYAVGIMAWEMFSGKPPFLSDNPVTMIFKHVHDDVPPLTSVCPGINPSVSSFVTHLTMRDLNARPTDASKALNELQSLESELPQADWNYIKPPAQAETSVLKDVTSQSHTAPPSPPKAQEPATDIPLAIYSSGIAQPNGQLPELPFDNNLYTSDGTMRKPRTAKADEAPQRQRPTEIMDDQNENSDPTTTLPRQQSRATRPVGSTENVHTLQRHKRLYSVIVAILVAALAAGGVAWWYFLGPGSYWSLPKPGSLECVEKQPCTITDIEWRSYRHTLETAGIPYHMVKKYSDTVSNGKIISTNPDSVGAKLSKRSNTKLEVTVSKGVRRSTIPTDINDPATEHGSNPLKALRQAGFTNIVHAESKDTYSEHVPEGALQSITPKPGTTLRHSAKVTVTLSKGPMPVSMPDVVGKPKDEADSAFSDAKLKANYTEEFSDSVPSGSIISASKGKGAQLHWGDSVDIVVSKGPETVTVPDVRGKTTDAAKKILQDLGFDVKVTAPLGDLAHTVRIQSIGAGQQVSVRDKNGNKTVITLTVI